MIRFFTPLLISLAIIIFPALLFAQVKIGGSPGAPVSSAVLELDGGGTKALRLPIVSSKDELADLPNPVNGLVVYAQHLGSLAYFHNGVWYEIKTSDLNFQLPHTGTYDVQTGAILDLNNTGSGRGIAGFSSIGTGLAGGTADGVGVLATAIGGTALRARAESGTAFRLTHSLASGRALLVDTGRVGIGTLNPLAALHTQGDFLVTGSNLPAETPGAMPMSGAGTRMIFSEASGAFRAGKVDGNEWNSENVGHASAAFGRNSIASGKYSFAAGYQSQAISDWAVVIGSSAIASGVSSHSIGFGTIASGANSTAIGDNSTASATQSMAFGVQAEASGMRSLALGRLSKAKGEESVAMGYNSEAPSRYEVAIGVNNTLYTPSGGSSTWNPNDRLFTIGNGGGGSRSNAMVVLKNGNVGIGNNTPTNKLDLNGDFNLTGRLRVNGNGGVNGQVLTSTGTGLAWSTVNSNPQIGYKALIPVMETITPGNNGYPNFSKTTGFGNFNDGGFAYNTGFRELTIPSAGVYQINASVVIATASSTNGSVSLFIEINDDVLPYHVVAMDQRWLVSPHSNIFDVLQASANVKLPTGARIKVRVQNDTNGNVLVTETESLPTNLSLYRVY
jgi:hypothetical protein